jgi:hypothetical protein
LTLDDTRREVFVHDRLCFSLKLVQTSRQSSLNDQLSTRQPEVVEPSAEIDSKRRAVIARECLLFNDVEGWNSDAFFSSITISEQAC